MQKIGCADCQRCAGLCEPHRLEWVKLNDAVFVQLKWRMRPPYSFPFDEDTAFAAEALYGFLWPRKRQSTRPRCQCGAPSSQSSPLCVRCRKGQTRRCPICNRAFYSPTDCRTCSAECRRARIEQHNNSLRKPGSQRATRRRASLRRLERLKASGCALGIGRARVGLWRRICERDGWKCWLCGGSIDPDLRVPNRWAGTADHIVPLVVGGSDTLENLRAAHFVCNSIRSHGGPRSRRPSVCRPKFAIT